jgi:hypothetical protein
LIVGTYSWWALVEPALLSRIGQLVDQSPTTENLQTMSGIDYTDYERREIEEDEIAGFLADYFQRDPDIRSVSEQERDAILEILDYVSDTFSSKKYVLGLAIDFILVAESLGEAVNPATSRSFEPELNGPDVINRYNRLETKKGQDLNTLTFLDDDGREHGIRGVENSLQTLYHDGLDRLNYPSSAPYSTGQWSSYMDLLGRCFQLSDTGRRIAVDELIDIGLATGFGRTSPNFPAHPISYCRSTTLLSSCMAAIGIITIAGKVEACPQPIRSSGGRSSNATWSLTVRTGMHWKRMGGKSSRFGNVNSTRMQVKLSGG